MFFRSPVGRLVSALFSLGIAAIVYFAFVKGKQDDAKNEADNNDPTQISSDKTLYKRANFAKALDALKSKRGGSPPMLKVQVLPGSADFQVRNGEKADGYRYNAKTGDLDSVRVEIVGSGSLEGSDFALARVRQGITRRLAAAVKEKNPAAHPTNMTLEKGLTNGVLYWSINAEGGGRTGLVYQARPNGSGLADPVEFSRRLRPGGGGSTGGGAPGAGEAQKRTDCIRKAGTDPAKIQACLK
jgi:hypothetical protein